MHIGKKLFIGQGLVKRRFHRSSAPFSLANTTGIPNVQMWLTQITIREVQLCQVQIYWVADVEKLHIRQRSGKRVAQPNYLLFAVRKMENTRTNIFPNDNWVDNKPIFEKFTSLIC